VLETGPVVDNGIMPATVTKASTSLLQRRLRIGYGRAAHLIDRMERDGIVGPADGSKPREILKPPDWLNQIEPAMR